MTTPAASPTSNAPCIAFFDSGQGGLTVWEAVVKRFPGLNTQYLGDNARYPYGNKGAQTVTRYSSEAVFYFSAQNAALVVVACGTASSVAVKSLQQTFRVPIVGIVEGFCEEAARIAGSRRTVAVLGTRFTVASGRFYDELAARGVTSIWQRACPLFVPLVEEGVAPGPMAHAASEMYLTDMPDDVKVVMLACTHFPRLAKSIAEFLEAKFGRSVLSRNADGEFLLARGKDDGSDPIVLIDSSTSIVASVESFLASHPQRAAFFGDEKAILCTDAPTRFAQVARLFSCLPLPDVKTVTLGT